MLPPKKTLDQRQKELQTLLATTVGRTQLRDLQAKYEDERGRLNAVGNSVITFILVSEREKGLIVG